MITEEDVDACWPIYHKAYLVDILNGDYSVEQAKEDITSLIGSRFDPRKDSHESSPIQSSN